MKVAGWRRGVNVAMKSIEEVLPRTRVITFDCYGTLIDWSAGLHQSFVKIFGELSDNALTSMVREYVEIEASVEAQPYQPYRTVLARTMESLAEQFELPLPAERIGALAESLGEWEPFADTNAALVRLKRRCKLGILSNIDGDLFARTAGHFDVKFDFVVTAEDVQSYKPNHGHFKTVIERHCAPENWLHVAQSLFHDGVPASELGVAFAWINRYGGAKEIAMDPLITLPDLKSLADKFDTV